MAYDHFSDIGLDRPLRGPGEKAWFLPAAP
jgi:hypothetical protein